MFIKSWDSVPQQLKNESVKKYHEILVKKRMSYFIKYIFDRFFSVVLLILLFPIIIVVGLCIKLSSPGPILYKQTRITQYGREFTIFKFRTMIINSGSQVTHKNDSRITKIGKILRKFRLDEVPQLLNIIIGDMSFVGTRPEVKKFVNLYSDEMKATLLMPAGVTSLASIYFKDEDELLSDSEDVEITYINLVLPQKMAYNLKSLNNFNFWSDLRLMIKTVYIVSIGKKSKKRMEK